MRIIFVILLAFTLMPCTSLAENKRVIDYYQQALSDYKYAITDLKAAHAEITAVRDDAAKKVAKIEALIAKYETALETTTQALEKKHEARLKAVKEAYRKKLAAEADLAELARQSAEDDANATRAILEGLGTSAEKVAKLTDAVSVSSDGKVGIGTDKPDTKLEIAGGLTVGHDGDNSYIKFKAANGKTASIGTQDDNDQGFYVHTGGQYRLSVNQNGNVGIGTTNPQYKLDVKGQVRADNVTVKSDQRLKKNIHPVENALTKLQSLRGVSFNWKDNAQNANTQIGLIAQEVEKVLPELVSTDSDGYKSIAYGKLTAVLVEAVKEQQRLIKQMARRIDALSVSQKQP